MIDTHCHLTSEALFEDLPQCYRRAIEAGVTTLITVATDLADSQRAVAVADHYHGVHATIGVHPHAAAQVTPDDWRFLRELRHNPNVVAWGEIGLDYHYDFSDRESQRAVFARQLQLSAGTELPLIIHCRSAVEDTVAMLEQHGFDHRPVVFHCFSGTAAEADTIVQHGWWLSFTGMVTFNNASALQDIARRYPLDQLLLETDAPYLSPVPCRKIKPNEPSLLVHTAAFLADLKGVSVPELDDLTSANARRFFRLPG